MASHLLGKVKAGICNKLQGNELAVYVPIEVAGYRGGDMLL